MTAKISLNLHALDLFKKLCEETDRYNVIVEETKTGATLVDAGIKADGGFLAGKIITTFTFLPLRQAFIRAFITLELEATRYIVTDISFTLGSIEASCNRLINILKS